MSARSKNEAIASGLLKFCFKFSRSKNEAMQKQMQNKTPVAPISTSAVTA